MFIVPAGYLPLLGRTWIRHLKINLTELDKKMSNASNQSIFSIDLISEITTKYQEIFKPKVGCIPNVTCSLQLKGKTKPVFIKEMEIPYALRGKVDTELDNLEQHGIITKVDTSEWGSPLVVIPKADGTVRLCVDYKITVNPCLKDAHYPIRKVDDILNSLKKSKYYCRLDLFKAYLHVKMDEDNQSIQTISTHRGTYKMNRLSFGIKTASSEFNRIIDQVLSGLQGVSSYFDDIIIHGETKEEC